MTRAMRLVHLFAVGFQLAAVALFAWCWVVTGAPGWVGLMGWCAFFGALSVHALQQDRKGLRA